MKYGHIRLYVAGCLASGCLLTTAFSQHLGRSTAFIQRVTSTDILLWESLPELEASKSYDLVIFQTTGVPDEPIRFIWALKNRRSGDSTLSFWEQVMAGESTHKMARKDVNLSSVICEQIEGSFRRLLEYNVYPPSSAPYVETGNEHVWIVIRAEKKQAIAGVALRDSLHTVRTEDTRMFSTLMDGLRGIIEQPSERDLILTELDRATAVFLQTPRTSGTR